MSFLTIGPRTTGEGYTGRLDDKVAVITGGTGGMRREIALLFSREGARVVIVGRDAGRGNDVVTQVLSQGGTAEFVAGDLSTFQGNQDLVERARKAFGEVDLLVSCAGMLGLGSVTEVPLEVRETTIKINLHAVS